jgi:DNA-binding transcriptional ArsR family regulator
MSNPRKHQREATPRSSRHTRPRPHPAASQSHLSELGTEVVATRLRTLGHPMRLRIMGALNGRPASADRLAEQFGVKVGVVRSHLGVLYRAGVVRRVDDGGRPTFELADWPSMWLVEQLAYRLRLRALEDAGERDDGADDDKGTRQ